MTILPLVQSISSKKTRVANYANLTVIVELYVPIDFYAVPTVVKMDIIVVLSRYVRFGNEDD